MHQRKLDQASVEFLPGPKNGFRDDKLWPFTVEGRLRMLTEVAVPMASMFYPTTCHQERPQVPRVPSIGWGTRLYGTKIQVECMKEGYRLKFPGRVPARDNKLVTITLRECDHWPQRNSNKQAWLNVARRLRAQGWDVFIVFDANHVPLSMHDRATFYMAAACNMFVSNGPAWFALALDAPVLMMRPSTDGIMNTCSTEFFDHIGIPKGGQIPGCGNHQRLVWRDDSEEEIIDAFHNYMSTQQ